MAEEKKAKEEAPAEPTKKKAPKVKERLPSELGPEISCLDDKAKDFLMVALEDSADIQKRNLKRAEKLYENIATVDPNAQFKVSREEFVKPFEVAILHIDNLKTLVDSIPACK